MKNIVFSTPSEFCRFKLIDKMLKNILLSKESDCLEIGCGNGRFISYAYGLGLRVTGIDISEKSVSAAREINPQAQIYKKDLSDVKDMYDFVFSFEVLEHIENDSQAIKNISGLIKDNGYFLFSVPAHPELYYDAVDKYYGHYRRYEKDKLTALLKENNFKIVYFWSYGLKLASAVANKVFSQRAKSGIKFGSMGDSLHEVQYPAYWKKIINPLLSCVYPLFYFYDLLTLNYDFNNSYLILCKKDPDGKI